MEQIIGESAELPPWMDAQFMADAFRKAGLDVEPESVRVERACKDGGGLLSETFRLRARRRPRGQGEASLVVKGALRSEGAMSRLGADGVFARERAVYAATLPAVQAALRAGPLAPACYAAGARPHFLLLEDLWAAGFRPGGARGLDRRHLAAALGAAARLHAASVLLVHRPPLDGALFRESLTFSDASARTVGELVENSLLCMVDILAQFPWFQRYRPRFQKLARQIYPRACEAVKACDDGLRVLLHGDLKRNNMMFRFVDDELQVRFYDFQISHVGSPAEDVVNLLYSSASPAVLRGGDVDALVAEYHGALQAALRSLGLHAQADGYPLAALRRHVLRLAPLAMFCAFQSLPMLLSEDLVDFDANAALADADNEDVKAFVRVCFSNTTFLDCAQILIPYFHEKGFI